MFALSCARTPVARAACRYTASVPTGRASTVSLDSSPSSARRASSGSFRYGVGKPTRLSTRLAHASASVARSGFSDGSFHGRCERHTAPKTGSTTSTSRVDAVLTRPVPASKRTMNVWRSAPSSDSWSSKNAVSGNTQLDTDASNRPVSPSKYHPVPAVTDVGVSIDPAGASPRTEYPRGISSASNSDAGANTSRSTATPLRSKSVITPTKRQTRTRTRRDERS